MSKSIIRWPGLGAFFVVLGTLVLLSWLFLDTILKFTFEQTLGRLNGAEVNETTHTSRLGRIEKVSCATDIHRAHSSRVALLHIDDGRLTDLRSSGQTGLQLLNSVLALLGTPAAAHKELPMAATQQFLGTGHDLTLALTQGTIAYWVKPETKAKGSALCQELLDLKQCTPAQASKVLGLGGFCYEIEWGRVGRGGLGALWQRLHHDTVHPTLRWALHSALVQSLDHLLHAFLDDRQRVVPLQPDARPSLLVASDAQAEPGQ